MTAMPANQLPAVIPSKALVVAADGHLVPAVTLPHMVRISDVGVVAAVYVENGFGR
jgi:hypothetical protein